MTRPAPTTAAGRTIPDRGDRGESVLSTVLAVLIMTLLGVAMWLMFENIWSDTAGNSEIHTETIDSGDNGGGTG